MLSGRRPIINAPGRTSYFTNSGVPYSTVDQPSDLANIDRLAQPKDAAFLNKDASGTRVSHGGKGVGLLVGPDGRNLLWDNLDGTFTGNTGQDVGVVKVTAQAKRHKSRKVSDMPTDVPFTQYGATNRSINGRRLTGSMPQLAKRVMHMMDTVVSTVEYELEDPRNPFSAKVKEGSAKSTHTIFKEEAVDIMVVANPGMRYQRIPMDRGFTPPRYPINTVNEQGQFQSGNIGILPYINPTIEINTMTYLKDIVVHPNFLDMNITATLANDNGGTATYTVAWGDGTTNTAASGVAVPTKTYAAAGIYDITITNDADPTDTRTEMFFAVPDGWLPATFQFDPAFTALTSLTATYNTVHNFAPFTVQGAPFIKLAVNFGDGAQSGSANQNLTGFMPTSQTLTGSVFNISHTYKRKGTFLMEITAERLSNQAADGLPGLTQQRQQIVHRIPVRVS